MIMVSPSMRPVEKTIQREVYAAFSSNLRTRGFSDRKPPPEERVVVGPGNVSSLGKSFTAFDIIIGAREEFGRYAMEISSGRRRVDDIPLSIWARFECEGGGSLGMLSHAFKGKSHHNTPSTGSRWGYIYVANLVPSDDAGELIRGCIALNDAVERIRKDEGYSKGLEAKEIAETLSAAVSGVTDRNSLKGELLSGMERYILGWRNRYSFELDRIKLDQGVQRGLEAVADR